MKKRKALREKILKGVQLAVDNLIKEARETDDYLVFSENGKVVKIKARKIRRKASR